MNTMTIRKRCLWPGCILLLVLGTNPAAAQKIINSYDPATLAYWQQVTPEDIRRNFEQVIWPVLTPQERRVLSNVGLKFPLVGDELEFEPFYYVAHLRHPQPTVTMSILSLRFFGDLCLAYSWLEKNGYFPGTVVEYLSMLKHSSREDFPGGRYPLPLEALQIPDNARDDPEVRELFGRIYSTAIVFILAHELGHIYHAHPGYVGSTPDQSQRTEAEADRFALDLLQRIGDIPIGIPHFFLFRAFLEPNRWDFSSEDAYKAHVKGSTHPLTAHRLDTLAERLRAVADRFGKNHPDPRAGTQQVRSMAAEVTKLARMLEDQHVQHLLAHVGKTTDVPALAPRRPGELPLRRGEGRPQQTTVLFSGTYEGEISDATGALPVRMVLERRKESVTGTYSFGVGSGHIQGIVDGRNLEFQWKIGGNYGRGVLRAAEDGQKLAGTWGSQQSRTDRGHWSLRRQR